MPRSSSPSKKQYRAEKRPPSDYDRKRNDADLPRGKTETYYTPLNKSRTNILEEIKNKSFFSQPQKMPLTPEKRGRSKNCLYHEDHGHDTEHFWALRDFNETKINKGNLKQYKIEPQVMMALVGPSKPSSKHVVNVVIGGPPQPP